MVLILFRILLTLSSTSLFVFIYFVKANIVLDEMFKKHTEIYSYSFYLIIILILNLIVLWLIRFLDIDKLDGKEEVKSVELANQSFLPVYLGYFFVALSIDHTNTDVFFIIYLIIFIFTFISQTNYFNPIFVIFGFNLAHHHKLGLTY